jgi:hypothetical protein
MNAFSPITVRLAEIAMIVIREKRASFRVSQWESWK